MYEQDIKPLVMKRRRSYVPLVVILLLVAGLIVLFSWGAGRRPKTYHRIGAFPLHMEMSRLKLMQDSLSGEMLTVYGIMPCRAGFCVRTDAFVFTLRDWETGEESWQVSTAIPYADPKKAKIAWNPESEFHAAVSPDGHYFAAASADEDNLLVQTWRDGTPAGEVKILLPPLLPASVKKSSVNKGEVLSLLTAMTDDGRCFVSFAWRYTSEPLRAFVIEGDRIIAQHSGKEYLDAFSPDGTAALLNASMLARVAIEGDKLSFLDPVKLPAAEVQLGAGGTAVTEDGGIYRLSGKPVTAKGFTCDTVTTSGKYAILSKGNVTRAVELPTGDSWEIAVPQHNEGGDATEDGRHILAGFSSKPGGLTGLLRNAVGAQNFFIVLYEHPGRQRAWMRIDRLQPFSWWPSPDGRAVAFTTQDQCLLYRW